MTSKYEPSRSVIEESMIRDVIRGCYAPVYSPVGMLLDELQGPLKEEMQNCTLVYRFSPSVITQWLANYPASSERRTTAAWMPILHYHDGCDVFYEPTVAELLNGTKPPPDDPRIRQ